MHDGNSVRGDHVMPRVWRCVVLTAAAAMLAACSATDFNTPVVKFGQATDLAAKQFDTYNAAINKALAERTVHMALASTRATYGRYECNPDATRCTLAFVNKDGSVSTAIQSLDGIDALMTGVKNYAAGLTAIVAANSGNEVDTAITSVKTNLLSLANDGDTLNKQLRQPDINLASRVSLFASPVADAATYALNKALEGIKIAALRQATSQMEDLMPDLTRIFNLAAETAWVFRRDELHRKFRVALKSFNRSKKKTKEQYDALESARAEYDAVLKQQGSAGAIFQALAQAHSALTDAVHNPTIDSASLLAAIQRVSDESVKLATIAKEFQDAQKKAVTGAGQTGA